MKIRENVCTYFYLQPTNCHRGQCHALYTSCHIFLKYTWGMEWPNRLFACLAWFSEQHVKKQSSSLICKLACCHYMGLGLRDQGGEGGKVEVMKSRISSWSLIKPSINTLYAYKDCPLRNEWLCVCCWIEWVGCKDLRMCVDTFACILVHMPFLRSLGPWSD